MNARIAFTWVFTKVLNYLEKLLETAWQEGGKYRKYIFASRENLLTRKEKVKNIRQGDWQRDFLLYNQKFRSWNFSDWEIKKVSLSDWQTKLILYNQ